MLVITMSTSYIDNSTDYFAKQIYLKASADVKNPINSFGEKWGDEAVDHKMDLSFSYEEINSINCIHTVFA